MKKLLITCLLIICSTMGLFAQNSTITKRKMELEKQKPMFKTLDYELYFCKDRFNKLPVVTIIPSIKTLTAIVNCSSNEFFKIMSTYGYQSAINPLEEYTSTDYLLYKTEGFAEKKGYQGIGTNYIYLNPKDNHACMFGSISSLFPRNAISKLKAELEPNLIDNSNLRELNFYPKLNVHESEKYVIFYKDGYYMFDFAIIKNNEKLYYKVDVWWFGLKKAKDDSSVESYLPYDSHNVFTDIIFCDENGIENDSAQFCRIYNSHRYDNAYTNNFINSNYYQYKIENCFLVLYGEGIFTDIDTVGGLHLVEGYRQTKYYHNGAVLQHYFMKNNVKNGICNTFFDNGRLKSRCNYVNGVQDGEYVSYYKNGDIKCKTLYSNGLIVSGDSLLTDNLTVEVDTFYDNGKLKGEWLLKNGLLDGNYYTYYENGLVKNKKFFVNGVQNGEDISYYRDGEIQRKAFYVDGKLEGKIIDYDDNGILDVQSPTYTYVLNYQNGILDGRQIAYKDYDKGTIWCEDFYGNGLPQKEITYNEDGTIRRIYTLISCNDSTSFTFNHTLFFTEKEDSTYSKISIDMIYEYNPSCLTQPFIYAKLDAQNQFNSNYVLSRHGVHSMQSELFVYGLAHGKCQKIDRKNRIVIDGQYSKGERSGLWKFYNYEQKWYKVFDYEGIEPTHYYTLNNEPYSGTIVEYSKDENDDKQYTIELTIKNSLIQKADYLDSQTGKIIDTKHFNLGFPHND